MPKEIQVINPALEKNIDLVVALMRQQHGENPGLLAAYEVYTLSSAENEVSSYSLTLPVLQLVADSESHPDAPKLRLNVVEPTYEAEGVHGSILPVIQSIILKDGKAIFDQDGPYVVKEMMVDRRDISDKPDKPHVTIRAANREQYLASQMPHLGAHYKLTDNNHFTYLHMRRAPGLPLDSYINKLNAEQFLRLSCALLEQVPQQTHRVVTAGKHRGNIIVHCDLKPANIMAQRTAQDDWIISVVDLGLAKARKNAQFITKRDQGNLMVADSIMIKSLQAKMEFAYTEQTDLYAIFVCIVHLAGATARSQASDQKQLLKDLYMPNLHGLFHNMGFDRQTKTKLTELIEKMLCDDRARRVSRETALQGFQAALNSLVSQKVDAAKPEPVAPVKVTAEDLKTHAEQNLDDIIVQKKQFKQSKFETIRLWIQRYRALYTQASDAEKERFASMAADVKVSSFFINDLLRSDLINEYDDTACTRLLLRHDEILRPLKVNHKLPAEWQARFNSLVNNLPLQCTTADMDLYEKIALFKKNVSAILGMQFTENSPLLLCALQDNLQTQLAMNFEHWYVNLPAYIKRFNKQYYCASQIMLLVKRAQEILFLKNGLEKELTTWAEKLSMYAMNDIFPPQGLRNYFDLFYDLIDELILYSRNLTLLPVIIQHYPLLTERPISLELIADQIQKLNIQNDHEVTDLVTNLSLLSTITSVYNKLHHDTGSFYFEVIILAKNDFAKLLVKKLNPETLVTELNSMLKYLDATERLEAFCNESVIYHHVCSALRILMLDKTKTLSIDELMQPIDDVMHLNELDTGLEMILSKTPAPELGEKLLAEFTKYSAYPNRYRAPMNIALNPFNFYKMSVATSSIKTIKKSAPEKEKETGIFALDM